jgi:hypothetical protein
MAYILLDFCFGTDADTDVFIVMNPISMLTEMLAQGA